LRFEEISDGRWAASAGGHSLIVVGWFERSKELPTFAENKIAKGSHPGTSQPVEDAPPAIRKFYKNRSAVVSKLTGVGSSLRLNRFSRIKFPIYVGIGTQTTFMQKTILASIHSTRRTRDGK
jgi:hypothetical protein